jgi:dTDP-4-amino-4,6-dideoxygalactose transaminase
LDDWAAKNGVGLPYVPPHCQSAYHLFYILLPDGEQRQKLIDHLKERGIFSVFHYQPLHLSEMGRRFGGARADCPVTESVSERLLRLPFYNGLDDADLTRVVNAIQSFRF